MKIAVISDTHTVSLQHFPDPLLKVLKQADLIIHAGDFTHPDVLRELCGMGEVKAVYGNNDFKQLRGLLGATETFSVNGKRIGLIHGWGQPWGLEDRIRKRFGSIDLIIYGHSHRPYNDVIGGVHFFNPGVASETYGILEIDDEIHATIVKI
jgi:putative phosphoesterase